MSEITDSALRYIEYAPKLSAEIHRILSARAVRGLTPVQAKLFDYIRAYIAKEGYAPTISKMADYMGFAGKGWVHGLLVGLEERGVIRRLPSRSRAISIVGQAA